MEPALSTGIFLVMTGAVTGFLSGALGVGGGFLMVPVEYSLLLATGLDPTLAIRIAFATSLAVILPTTISGAYGHHCRDCVIWKAVIPMGITGIAGAFLGGTIASHAPGDLLSGLFGILLVAAAVRMLIPSPTGTVAGSPPESVVPYLLLGFPIGLVSGLLGIGGGVLMVPAFIYLIRYSVHQAVGTSSALIVIYSIGGIAAYVVNGFGVPGLPPYTIGYIDLLLLGTLAAGSIPLAHFGVRVAHGTSPLRLKQVFAVLLLLLALKMIGVFSWLGIPYLS